jgi:Flp pilus assembly CpaE family ATPase
MYWLFSNQNFSGVSVNILETSNNVSQVFDAEVGNTKVGENILRFLHEVVDAEGENVLSLCLFVQIKTTRKQLAT